MSGGELVVLMLAFAAYIRFAQMMGSVISALFEDELDEDERTTMEDR